MREATPWELMGNTTFCTSLAGEELGRIPSWGTDTARHAELRAAEPVHDARRAADDHRADHGPGGAGAAARGSGSTPSTSATPRTSTASPRWSATG